MKKQKAPPAFVLAPVTKPFHAEHKKEGLRGPDREDINLAMDDGKKMGVGAQVLSAEGTLLSKWVSTVPPTKREKEDWYGDGPEGPPRVPM